MYLFVIKSNIAWIYGAPRPRCTPDTWDGSRKQGVWLSVLPSTVNCTELGAQECRDSVSMRYGIKPLTYLAIAVGVAWLLTYATPSTVGREASSRGITTSSVIELSTMRVRSSPPLTCMVTPKYTQFALCVEGRKKSKGLLWSMRKSLRGVYS